MNDLHDLLERVSEPSRDWLADSHALLHEGRRRVRRRRLAGAAVAGVAALGLGGVAASQLGDSTDRTVGPAGSTSYADLDLTPLSTGQVEARCVWRVREMGLSGPFTVRDDTPYQTKRPWHVGSRVLVVPKGGGQATVCRVPESTAEPTLLGLAPDVGLLQQMCGAYAGIDVSGWEQVAAAADSGSEDGVYRSGNGWILECKAQDNVLSGVQRSQDVTHEPGWRGSGVCSPVRERDIECFGAGRVPDHAATEVDVTLPSGRVLHRPAVDGYWAIAVRDDASGPTLGSQVQPFRVKVSGR